MTGQTSTTGLLTLFGGVAVVMLMVDWSPMRAVAFAVIWVVAAGVLIVRDRRRATVDTAPGDISTAEVSQGAASDSGER
ncbi:hypothetical protein [Nocardia sp. NPDC058633]|uniref:hypothetical protein n=1 Tax=Nocardia sp. NPDC058633 TaxID=3346568 RepID=UPI00364EF6B4